MSEQIKTKYLIIGNSAGGIGAVEAIREVDETGEITLVSDEPYPAYSRPLISEYLAEDCAMERILYRSMDFYEQNKIHLMLGCKVVGIDTVAKNVQLADGGNISFEKVLMAPGGIPFVPRMDGGDQEGVFTFTTLDDAKKIGEYLEKQTGEDANAVVIGGGLIGLSVTEALMIKGVNVTVVEMKDWVLNTILDADAAAIVKEALQEKGINLITGITVAKINGDAAGKVSGVELTDGSTMPCNMVIVAIGVRPRIELAKDTPLKVNRGIVVDRSMMTSEPDIYACGDATEAYDYLHCENRLTPIWPNAYIGGRVAGFNMAGVAAEYPGGTTMNSLSYFGLAVACAGITNPADDGYEIIKNSNGSTYKKFVIKNGSLVGMQIIGNTERAGIVYNLIKNGIKVDGFADNLTADDFGLISLPAEVRQQIMELASTRTIPLPVKVKS